MRYISPAGSSNTACAVCYYMMKIVYILNTKNNFTKIRGTLSIIFLKIPYDSTKYIGAEYTYFMRLNYHSCPLLEKRKTIENDEHSVL